MSLKYKRVFWLLGLTTGLLVPLDKGHRAEDVNGAAGLKKPRPCLDLPPYMLEAVKKSSRRRETVPLAQGGP
jgi:hypothetical protein